MSASRSPLLPAPSLTPADQYRAATESSVVVDLSDRDHVELTGADRATFLHNFCTQDIKKLPVGRGAEAFVTNIKGRILGHVLVFVGEHAIWLDTVGESAGALVAHLDRYLISEDVQLTDRSGEWGEFTLIGPQAAPIVESLLPGSGVMQPFQHGHANGITVRRFSFTQQPGWLIGTARTELPDLAERLIAAGAIPCGDDVFQALRIEAGFPLYGIDLTEDHLAQEAGRTKQAISFTKGCYLGQEPIARIDALGHTNRELRRLRLNAPVVPVAGTTIVHPESRAEIGTISSGGLSPIDNVGVALAMLRREACVPGTQVQMTLDNTSRVATVLDR